MTTLDLAIIAIHGIILYAWGLFPALLACMSRPRQTGFRKCEDEWLPPVTFIVSAYNEENVIAARVHNFCAIDYPAAHFRVFIGVDGSSDRTAAEARAAAAGHPNIEIVEFRKNRGKVAVLKDLVARARRDGTPEGILVFTDANTDFEPDALLRLAVPFADPAVGGVCGKLVLVEPEDGKTDENIYWKLENWLKARESDLDSCLGANGAIYAIRAPLFWEEIPANTIVDDFVIGMKVREQGYRMVYEPGAVATEILPSEVRDEWKRRVRIGAGNYQAIRLCARCLKPSYGAFAWAFWSHKVLRWFTPHLMIAGFLLAAAGAVSRHPTLGFVTMGLYAGFALAAVLGVRRSAGVLRGALRGLQYLLAMQTALFMGFLRFCRGNLEGRWQRTAR